MKTRQFNGQRLKEALQFRGKRMTDLANELDISKQSLSLYINGENNPPYDNVAKISCALGFPFEYFMTEDQCTAKTDNTYFRSQSTAKKLDQNVQKIKLEYVAKIYEVLLNYVDFPEVNIPKVKFETPSNPFEADSDSVMDQIELIASSVRRHWNLGIDPIDNMQYLLESNGVIVTGFNDVDDKIDAFSQRVHVQGNGYIFIVALAIGDKSDVRLRFDMGHELGHILLHNWDESNDVLNKDEFNAIEKQANMFASAFLLPKESFGREVQQYPINVEYYRSLKKKWGVSIQAMMYRARQLKIITSNQFQYMMRTVSANGWRTKEPGDKLGQLDSTIFQGAIDVLFNGNYANAKDLIKSFNEYGIFLSQKDLEEIMRLHPGTLNIDTQELKLIKPKISFT